MFNFSPAEFQAVVRYCHQLTDDIVMVIDTAMARLVPMEIGCGHGSAGFGMNRRGTPITVSDNDVPVIRFSAPGGKNHGHPVRIRLSQYHPGCGQLTGQRGLCGICHDRTGKSQSGSNGIFRRRLRSRSGSFSARNHRTGGAEREKRWPKPFKKALTVACTKCGPHPDRLHNGRAGISPDGSPTVPARYPQR